MYLKSPPQLKYSVGTKVYIMFCPTFQQRAEKIQNVDQQTWLLIISEGHTFTVQCRWCGAVHPLAHDVDFIRAFQFSTVTLASTLSSLFQDLLRSFSLSSSTTLACMQPHEGAQRTYSEGTRACFQKWRQSGRWHQTPASGIRAVVSSEVNSDLVRMA